MAFEKLSIQNRNVEARLEAIQNNPDIDSREKKDIKEFLRLCELGQINKGKKLTRARLLKYLDVLKIPFSYFKKDSRNLTLKEVEKFDSDLSKDKIKNKQTGQPLAQNTKIEIRKLFKIYLRWKFKNNKAKYDKLTDWWDTAYKTRTPDFLTEQEVIALFDGCKNPAERFLIAVLFDSGARIQEFLNLRIEDVTEPTKEFPYYMFDFKQEYSKTKGRKIGLYWVRSEKAVRDYLKSLGDTRKDTLLFSLKNTQATYDSIRFFLNRLGNRTIKRDVNPHLLRHSSATFYANKMNRQELCIRYGWTFSSNMPDIYIARAGIEQQQIMETFKAQGMDKYRIKNEELEAQITNLHLEFQSKEKEMGERIERIKKDIELLYSREKKVKVVKVV